MASMSTFPNKGRVTGPESPSKGKLGRNSFIRQRPGASNNPDLFKLHKDPMELALPCLAGLRVIISLAVTKDEKAQL